MKPQRPASSPSSSSPFLSDDETARVMQGELKALLDAVPMSRSVLQHLAVLERVLGTEGLDGIGGLPQSALEKTTAQLASLPMPAQSASLPELLSLLRLALEARQRRVESRGASKGDSTPFLSSFLTDDKLIVSEASHTDFMRVMNGEPPRR